MPGALDGIRGVDLSIALAGPARFGATPARIGDPSPSLGHCTCEVLQELGLGDRIEQLRGRGVIA